MERVIYNLPVDWSWVPLGKVATLLNGRAYKQTELLAEGPTPVLRVGNFFSNRSWYYSDLDLPDDKYCDKGDLLYAWSASFGPKIWQGPKAIYHYHIWKILPSEYIDKKFLFYLLEKDSEEIKAQGNGVGMFHATKGGMEKMLVPLPPVTEQKRIVDKLDALLTRIDTAVEYLQENLDASKSLLASALFERFHQEVNPTPIKDIFNVYNGRAYKKPELLDSGKYKVIRIQNLKGGENYYYSDLELDENKYCESGDLLFSWSGTPGTSFGAFIWNDEKAIYHYHIWKMEPKVEIAPRYAYWVLKDITEEAIASARGVAGMLHITKGTMESFVVSLPSYEAQQKIAKELDELALKSEKLEVEISLKIDSLKHLKASILDSAFKGEL